MVHRRARRQAYIHIKNKNNPPQAVFPSANREPLQGGMLELTVVMQPRRVHDVQLSAAGPVEFVHRSLPLQDPLRFYLYSLLEYWKVGFEVWRVLRMRIVSLSCPYPVSSLVYSHL